MNSNELTETPEDELSPFIERAGYENFYPVKARVNLLADIKKDISELVSVVLLTGESGSGKSTICRKLVVDGFSDRKTLHFKNSVQSFEDVVRTVAKTVNVEVHDLSRKGITEALANIVASVEEHGTQIVIVCDAADRIYLATLERIRKMLDAMNATTVHLQVIFIGAESLLENLNQLKICDFADVPESRYVLKPLSLSETTTYIEHCCKQLPLAKSKIFTPAIIDKIYQVSRGNLDEINTLSQKLLKGGIADAEKVLSVSPTPIAKKLAPGSVQKLVSAGLDKSKLSWALVGGIGGAVAIGVIALIMIGGDEDKPEMKVGNKSQVIEKQLEAVGPPTKTVELVTTPPLKEVEEKQVVAEPIKQNVPVNEKNVLSEEKVASKSVTPQSEQLVENISSEIVKDISSESAKVEEPLAVEKTISEIVQPEVVEEVIAEVAEPIIVAAPVQKVKKITEPVEIPVLKPGKIKVLVEAEQTEEALIQEKEVSSIVISSLTSADEASVPLLRDTDEKKKIIGDAVPPKAELLQQKEVRVIPEKTKEIVDGQTDVEPLFSEQSSPVELQNNRIVEESEVTTKKVQQVSEVIVPEPVPHSALYNSRTAAGGPWLNGKRNDKYTMQLMVISSESAEEKLNEILAREGYAKEAEAFYIFKKDSTPPSVFVFYGEYSTMTEAREARNNVSKLLKKHKPYVLSVAGAMRKVK